MCLAVPLKVVWRANNDALGEFNGLQKKIRLDFLPEVKEGDYVMVHAGFAIEKLTEEMARENIRAIREVINVLQGPIQE